MSESTQSDKCIQPWVQFQAVAVVGLRAFQISDPLEAFPCSTACWARVFKRQGLFVGVQRVLVPLLAIRPPLSVVGGTECAFDGNGKIICIDGLGIATALLERMRIRAERQTSTAASQGIARRTMPCLNCPVRCSRGQFIDGRLVQGVLLQGFVQVADGLCQAPMFSYSRAMSMRISRLASLSAKTRAFETVNGQLVLRHLAVHRAEGNEHFLVQGFDFQQLLEQGHGLDALTRSVRSGHASV